MPLPFTSKNDWPKPLQAFVLAILIWWFSSIWLGYAQESIVRDHEYNYGCLERAPNGSCPFEEFRTPNLVGLYKCFLLNVGSFGTIYECPKYCRKRPFIDPPCPSRCFFELKLCSIECGNPQECKTDCIPDKTQLPCPNVAEERRIRFIDVRSRQLFPPSSPPPPSPTQPPPPRPTSNPSECPGTTQCPTVVCPGVTCPPGGCPPPTECPTRWRASWPYIALFVGITFLVIIIIIVVVNRGQSSPSIPMSQGVYAITSGTAAGGGGGGGGSRQSPPAPRRSPRGSAGGSKSIKSATEVAPSAMPAMSEFLTPLPASKPPRGSPRLSRIKSGTSNSSPTHNKRRRSPA